MERQLLKEADIYPSTEVLRDALGGIYPVYEAFTGRIADDTCSITTEWRYYNDGKSWLAKGTYRSKTIFWLSVWEGYFQVGLYFTAKHVEGVASLPIDEAIKEQLIQSKPVGKLLPLSFRVARIEQLDDLLTVIQFKRSLK